MRVMLWWITIVCGLLLELVVDCQLLIPLEPNTIEVDVPYDVPFVDRAPDSNMAPPLLSAAVFYTMCTAFSRCCPPQNSLGTVCTCTGPSQFLTLQCKSVESDAQLASVFRSLYYYSRGYGKLMVTDSRMTKLSDGLLGNVQFEYIHIKKAPLTEVEPTALEGSRNTVKRIEIVHCDLKTFPFQNVSTYPKLEVLELYYNNLRAIPDYAFKFNPKLHKIDLSFNKINYIGNFAFYYVPNLEYLDLRHNKLKVINNYAFAVHKKPDVRFTLDLSGNQIVLIADHAFDNEHFKTLNMSDNKLRAFPEKHFRPLLTEMGERKYGIIDLHGNSLKCDCESVGWLLRMSDYYRRFISGYHCKDSDKMLESMSTYELSC